MASAPADFSGAPPAKRARTEPAEAQAALRADEMVAAKQLKKLVLTRDRALELLSKRVDIAGTYARGGHAGSGARPTARGCVSGMFGRVRQDSGYAVVRIDEVVGKTLHISTPAVALKQGAIGPESFSSAAASEQEVLDHIRAAVGTRRRSAAARCPRAFRRREHRRQGILQCPGAVQALVQVRGQHAAGGSAAGVTARW